MAVAFVNSYTATTSSGTATLTSAAFTPATDELLVVKFIGEDATVVPSTPTASGGGVTWTLRVSDTTSSWSGVYIWTGVVTAGGSSKTISISVDNGGLNNFSMCVERWTGAMAGATAGDAQGNTSAPSATVNTKVDGSYVTWANGDWSAQAPGSRTYRSGATESGLHNANPQGGYVGYYAYQPAATAGNQTIGLTVPSSQKWNLIWLELWPTGTTLETITYQGAGAVASSGATGTTHNVAYPSGIQAGDLLVVFASFGSTTATATASGWTSTYSGTSSTGNRTGQIYKIADGSESGSLTLTVTNTARVMIMARFSGVDPTTPLDGTQTNRAVTTSTTPFTMAAQTPTMWGTFPIWNHTENNTTGSWTASTTATEIMDNQANKSGAVYVSTAPLSSVASTGTRGATPNVATANSGLFSLLRPKVTPPAATGFEGTLDLVGSRTLDVAGSPSTSGALAITGSRALGPAGSPAPQGTLGLSRAGSLILSGSPTTPGTLALTGTGATNSYVGIPTHAGTLGLSQSRTINLSGAPNVSASLSVSGTGGVAGQGTPAPVSTVTISGTRTLSMSAAVAIPGTLTLSGSRLLSLAGSTAGFGTLNLSGSRTLNLNGSPSWNVTLGLSGSRVLAQAGAPAFSDTVNLFGIRSLTQGGSPSATGTLGLTGTGSDGYSASPATSGILPLSQFSTLGASGAPNPTENLALDLTRDLQFSGSRDGSGELLLSGTGALDFSGTASIPSALWLAAFSGLAAGGSPAMSDSLGLAASTTLDLSGNLAVSGTLGLEGSGGTGQQGNPAIPGTTTLSGAGLLNLLATALSMASTMNLTGDRVLVLSGVASAEGQGSLNLSGSRVLGFTATPSIFGTLARSGTGVLEAEGAQANAGTLLLEGSRTLTLDAAPAVAGTLALTSAGEFTFDGVVLTEGTLLITGSRTLVLSGQVVGEDTGGMFLKDGTRLHAFMLVGGILIPVTPNFGE